MSDGILDQLIAGAEDVSTVTGKPTGTPESRVQQAKDVAVAGVRYGPPVVAGAMTGNLALPAAVSGLSEFAARRIEKLGQDPTVDGVINDLMGGGVAAGLDIATGGLFKGIGWATRKALKPKDVGPVTQLAQDTLEAIPAERGTPYSLTLGRLNSEERGFINWLESLPRAAIWGRGKMRAADLRNVDKVTEMFDSYVKNRARETTGDEFAMFLKRTLGDIDKRGEAFDPVEAYRKYLYKQFDDALVANPQVTVDATPLLKYFQKRGKDPYVRSVYESGRSLEQLPSVKKPKQIEGVATDVPATISPEEQWSVMSMSDVDAFLKNINSNYANASDAEKAILDHIKGKIAPQFKQQLAALPDDARAFYDAAQSFHGAKQKKMYNKTIMSIRKALSDKPSTVIHMFTTQQARADRLRSLKDALYFSAGVSGGREAVDRAFDAEVLRPLRYHILTSAVDKTSGVLDPKKLITNIDRYSKVDENFLKEVFGSEAAVDNIRKLAVTIQEASSKYSDNIFIQLAQASAIGGALGGVTSFAFSDDPKTIGLGAATGILVAPRLLASVFSNPKFTKTIIDGLQGGSKSAAFGRMLRKLSTQWIASKQDPLTPESFNYYTSIPEEPRDPSIGRPAPYNTPTRAGELPFALQP